MVTKTEQSEVTRLDSQVENGGGGAWEYLCLVRKLKVGRSDKVVKHGLSILNDAKKRSALGADEWTLCDCSNGFKCLDHQGSMSPISSIYNTKCRLEVMLLEAKGAWAEAEKAYASLLEDNPFDQVVQKRRIAMEKARGNISAAIDFLNRYKQAAFCYEELILAHPTIPLYHLAYADVLHTLGGLDNIQAAKTYYASTIDLTGGKSTKAIYGICLCRSAIASLSKSRNKDEKENELASLAAGALEKDYKYRASDKLPH